MQGINSYFVRLKELTFVHFFDGFGYLHHARQEDKNSSIALIEDYMLQKGCNELVVNDCLIHYGKRMDGRFAVFRIVASS